MIFIVKSKKILAFIDIGAYSVLPKSRQHTPSGSRAFYFCIGAKREGCTVDLSAGEPDPGTGLKKNKVGQDHNGFIIIIERIEKLSSKAATHSLMALQIGVGTGHEVFL